MSDRGTLGLDARDDGRDTAAPSTTPEPFDAATMRQRLAWDRAWRWGLLMLALAGFVAAAVLGLGGPIALGVAVVLLGVGWFMAIRPSAAVLMELATIGPDTAAGRPEAGEVLAAAVERFGLSPWVRLLAYRGLAAWRLARGETGEAVAIAAALCGQRLGPGEVHRAELLLLIADTELRHGRPAAAYPALASLYAMPVSLPAAVRRLKAQTRYESAIGRWDCVMYRWPQKVAMADLLEPATAAEMHGDLAAAAEATGQPGLAAWLRRRQALLTPTDGSGPPPARMAGDLSPLSSRLDD
ncbi:MAG: hypothetical protein AAGB29_12950 [Planctomycetota bacterium]